MADLFGGIKARVGQAIRARATRSGAWDAYAEAAIEEFEAALDELGIVKPSDLVKAMQKAREGKE